MGKSKQRDNPWVHVAVAIVLRLVYALGTMIAIIVFVGGATPRHATSGSGALLLFTPGFWVFLLVVVCIASAVGPALFRKSAKRGRGTLDAVRRASRRR